MCGFTKFICYHYTHTPIKLSDQSPSISLRCIDNEQKYQMDCRNQCLMAYYIPRQKMNRTGVRSLSFFTILLVLVVQAHSYALDGSWNLRTSELSKLNTLKTKIAFNFQRTVDESGNLRSLLTVQACNQLTYLYQVEDDQILLRFAGTGRPIRVCTQNELAFLRGYLDTVFYFYILDTVLLLLTPSGNPVKLDRAIDLSRPNLNSQYTITSAFTFDPIADPLVIANSTHLALCRGSTLFSYRVVDKQKVSLTKVKGGACNGLLSDILPKATLMRVLGAGEGRIVRLYDDKMRQLGQYSFLGDISFENATAVKTNFNFENPWNASLIREIASNRVTVKDVNSTHLNATGNAANLPQTTNSSINATNSAQGSTVVDIKSIQKNSSNTTTSTSGDKTASLSSNSSLIKQPTTVSNGQNATIPATVQHTNTSKSTAQTATPSNLTFSPVTQVSDLYGFWYPVWASPGQLIINSARLLLSSSCTAFSSYSFSGSSFTKLSLLTAEQSCDLPLRAIIFNPENLYYLCSSPKTLEILDKSGKSLLVLTSTPSK